MKLKKSLIVTLIGIISISQAGTLSGHVKYDGKAPKPKKLRMDADPVCGSSHSGTVYGESFKMAADGSMEEALVYLKKVNYSGGTPEYPSSSRSKRLYL